MKKLFILFLCLLTALSFTASAAKALPYTISLTAGTAIHSGPGKDYAQVQSLDEKGVFTIVEEALGADDALWGKLKSGAGWVQISHQIFSEDSYTLSLPAGTAVYASPDHRSGKAQTIDSDGVFTIVEETRDTAGNPWGKLKSGAGWVALNIYPYTTPLYPVTYIYDGPGYDFSITQTLDEKGMFTIVEEAWDESANLWGRLKSGAGWVFLKSEQALIIPPIHIEYASDTLLLNNPLRLIADDSEYAVHIALIPNETIRSVAFTSLEPAESDFAVNELLFTADELAADTPFVASVAFPGDMTSYGIAFIDAAGNARRYSISISGRDGSLVLTEQN